MHTISGKPVSAFSFGTMQFGGKASETESAELYAACRSSGINFFDTAHAYSGGESERILGQLAASERDDTFIATKCGEGQSVAPDLIRREFDISRGRLGMDNVDLLYFHRWDVKTPLEQSFSVLAEFIQQGSVRFIGVSNYAAWQIMKAQRVAEDLGVRIKFLQPMYSLVKRQVEVEILPMAVSEGFAEQPIRPAAAFYSEEAGEFILPYDAVRAAGRSFRDTVLAEGGGAHPMDVFRSFRGRDPETTALLRHLGLDQAAPSPGDAGR